MASSGPSSDVFQSSSSGQSRLPLSARAGLKRGFRYSATKAVFLTLVATLFPFLDIPVYWPILLVYFCVLFVVTMRRQIVHMRKWKYLPFDIGRKTTYNGLGNGSRSI